MLIFNSIKLFFGNLLNMWRWLLYNVIIFVLAASIFLGVVFPIVDDLLLEIDQTGFFDKAVVILSQIARGSIVEADITEIISITSNQVIVLLSQNMKTIFLTLGVLILIYVAYLLLVGIGEYPIRVLLNRNMIEQSNYSFIGILIKNVGKSIVIQLCFLLLTIPIDVLIILLLVYIATTFANVIGLYSLFFIFFICLVIISFRMTVFSLWKSYIVIEKCGIFRALGLSIAKCFKYFWTIFSQVLMLLFLLYLANMIVALFTVGVGLIVSLASSCLIVFLFESVAYYSVNNKRFYVGNQTVVVPKMENSVLSVETLIDMERQRMNNDPDDIPVSSAVDRSGVIDVDRSSDQVEEKR